MKIHARTSKNVKNCANQEEKHQQTGHKKMCEILKAISESWTTCAKSEDSQTITKTATTTATTREST